MCWCPTQIWQKHQNCTKLEYGWILSEYLTSRWFPAVVSTATPKITGSFNPYQRTSLNLPPCVTHLSHEVLTLDVKTTRGFFIRLQLTLNQAVFLSADINGISAGSGDSRHIDRRDDLHVLLTEPLSSRRQGNVVRSARIAVCRRVLLAFRSCCHRRPDIHYVKEPHSCK